MTDYNYRSVVEIVEYTYLVKFNSGSMGRAPKGVWGEAPEAESFFLYQGVNVAIKR